MPGLPPINICDLAALLRDPTMPAHNIMIEVADKIGSRWEMTGQSLMEDILMSSLLHPDSENEDEEENEDYHQSYVREVPCRFCIKVFGSTMSMKTHVLVSHPKEESTILNTQRVKLNESERKEPSLLGKRSRAGKGVDNRDKKQKLSPKSEIDNHVKKSPISLIQILASQASEDKAELPLSPLDSQELQRQPLTNPSSISVEADTNTSKTSVPFDQSVQSISSNQSVQSSQSPHKNDESVSSSKDLPK